MISSRKIIIWTILTHVIIVVGFGHGIVCLGIIEAFTFPYFIHNIDFRLSAAFEQHLPVVGLSSLMGQIALVISLFIAKHSFKIALHVLGVIFLLVSLVYFAIHTNEGYIHLLGLSAIPFAICLLLTFTQTWFIKCYHWILKNS